MQKGIWGGAGVFVCLLASVASATFTTFESGQVRPLAMTADGSKLLAVNTPDNRLEIFSLSGAVVTHLASVPVGLEPVAVAVRGNSEAWVVNHLSDSISIVDLSANPVRVKRTLLVGDEPRDIVFAGSSGNRAFITCAHRGQNNPVDPQLTTPGIGRADVWVFDATNLGSSLGGDRLTIVTSFADTPRALAVAPGGGTVYAAAFHSGNRTAVVSEQFVCDGGSTASSCVISGNVYPGGLPAPNANTPQGITGPETALIVKHNGTFWADRLGRNWNNAIRFNLPDKDVFVIDANANPPVQIAGSNGFYTGVGTVLFNMLANPVSGKIYVSNTDAKNEVRFEGTGSGGSTVRSHLAESRITVLDPGGHTVTALHLNKHINYSIVPSPAGTKDASLATPVQMAISSDGQTLYVAAFGSSKVGVFDTAQLENNTFTPTAANHIGVSGGGPTGVLLDEGRGRLYVLTRFDNGLAVVDTGTRAEVDHLSLYNPEPPAVVNGRRFLYDATLTSSNGEAACASCHIFGDLDDLAWDLGNPDDVVVDNPNPFRISINPPKFHPMKGPMTTQSLRGMSTHGPMHWRGDRTGADVVGGDAFNENEAFKRFNPAFVGLIGRDTLLSTGEMQAFADFILQVQYPPNPIRSLDNALTTDQAAGRNIYFNSALDAGVTTCNDCHVLDRSQGAFGTDGLSSFDGEPQEFKIAHLRNAYTKVGMFGFPPSPLISNGGLTTNQGDQIRGFGFLHDGSIDNVFRFLSAAAFKFPNATQKRQVENFVLAFETDLAPIVGQQTTLTDTNSAAVGDRLTLLLARAAAGDCDLVVKGIVGGLDRGWYRTASGLFQGDRALEAPLSDASLRGLAAVNGQPLTYTCAPLGSAVRMGVDRDEDGFFDRDELDAGSDPSDAQSVPPAPTATPTPTASASATPTATQTATSTASFTPTATTTPTATPSNTLAPGVPTYTPTQTPTFTLTPSATSTPTLSPMPTFSPTPAPAVFCAPGRLIDKPKLRVGHDLDPTGDEDLTISGRLIAPPVVNPAINGLRFAVYDNTGALLYQRLIPGGLRLLPGQSGWVIARGGRSVKFVDDAGSVAPGITRVTVRSSTRTADQYSFSVRGKRSAFRILGSDSPVSMTVVLGGQSEAQIGQCGSFAFNPASGVAPRCKLSVSGNTLQCR